MEAGNRPDGPAPRWHDDCKGWFMLFHLKAPVVRWLVSRFPELNRLLDQLTLGATAEISATELTPEQLRVLEEYYAAEEGASPGLSAQVATLRQALAYCGRRFQAGELEHVLPELAAFLVQDAVFGWLFKAERSGKPIAHLVSRVDYTHGGEEETARLTLELKANAMGKVVTTTVLFRERDVVGKNVAEMLLEKGLLKETPALVANYDRSAALFFQWRAEHGRQFCARGTGIFAEDPAASHRTTDWTRKSVVVLSSSGGWARLVNDESILTQRDSTLEHTGEILTTYLRKAGRSNNYDENVEKAAERRKNDIPEGLFKRIPIHGYVLMFHLDLHHHLWVHVDDMQPYAYRPDLKQKLVLPPEQTDLIDILTAEMGLLTDDIIEGKSGGTTVLCAGPPGVGKTLTAEVYSEIIGRPLYRVHSGQLGLSVGDMEAALKATLTRAQRWGAVMLIDEADVYIKRRDDDIAANAVVGVFLRVLEYFNGLLFLTTNRTEDIDEAIVSRCIAVIRYQPPDSAARRRIWEVMAEQFNLSVEGELLETLANCFPKACGRDIKGLAKLVAKYCRHKQVTPTLDVFLRCSTFRGLTPTKTVTLASSNCRLSSEREDDPCMI